MSGVRLNLIVEGQTEEAFVRRILKPHLADFEVWAGARSVYTSRKGHQWWRGGMTSFARAQRDIVSWIKQDQSDDARFSTMFDLYRLPGDFPGMDVQSQGDPYAHVCRLESGLAEAIRSQRDDGRFIPHLMLHEFEAIFLCNPSSLSSAYPSCSRGTVAKLEALLAGGKSPEEIDLDHPPSKRLKDLIPTYQKVAAVGLLANELSLPVVRDICPHFGSWLTALEGLGGPGTPAPASPDS